MRTLEPLEGGLGGVRLSTGTMEEVYLREGEEDPVPQPGEGGAFGPDPETKDA